MERGEGESIFLGGNGGEFGEGLLEGGLRAVHEVLGAAEALPQPEY